MSIFVPNNAGTVRFNSGSTTINGTGTLFKGYRAGSTISVPGIGAMQLAADPTSDTEAMGVVEWGGSTTSFHAFQYLPRNEEGVFTDKLVQLLDLLSSGNIAALGDLTLEADKLIKATGPGTLALNDFAPWAQSMLGLAGVGNHLPYITGAAGANIAALTRLTAFARSLLDDADAAAARGTLDALGGDDVTVEARTILASTLLAATSLAALTVGTRGVSNSIDSMVLISRIAGNEKAENGHAFSDSSQFNRGPGSGNGYAYNSFDARCEVDGAYNYDHYAAFQDAPDIGGTGDIQAVYGLFSAPRVDRHAVRRIALDVVNPSGAGPIDTNYGVRVRQQTRGTKNWAIYTEGSTPSYFNIMPETGAEGRKIIERGSNANGEYVRFADGTQICSFLGSVSVTAASSYILTGSLTFPAAFSQPPSTFGAWVQTDPGDTNNSRQATIYSYLNFPTPTACRFGGWMTTGSAPSAGTQGLSYIAVGRWF